jgi:hypothetical protein
MQIKCIISNHSIQETTLCATQTYGETSGGQQCPSEAAGAVGWLGEWVVGCSASSTQRGCAAGDHGAGQVKLPALDLMLNLASSAGSPLSSIADEWQGSNAQFTLLVIGHVTGHCLCHLNSGQVHRPLLQGLDPPDRKVSD